MPTSFKYTTKKTGKLKGPNLSDPQLRIIGELMVEAQTDRWFKSIDATGSPALKLARRYAIIKQAVLHKRPVRDMVLTGKTLANFSLRKAAEGRIRAENTTRLERQKALRANSYDQMIGFALTDVKVVLTAAQAEYGQYVSKAWVPLYRTTDKGLADSRRPTAAMNTP